MSEQDIYETLSVDKDASSEEIKQAYYNLARDKHPDVNAGQGHDEFTAITAAYSTLIDPERRSHYDETGETGTLSAEEMARQQIATLFCQIIDHPQFNPTENIFKIMKNSIKAKQSEFLSKKATIKKKIRELTDLSGRISGSDKFFNGLLDKMIGDLTQNHNGLNFELTVSDIMLRKIKGYKHRPEEMVQMLKIDGMSVNIPAWTGHSGTTGSTTGTSSG